jgi:hypothetical protein|tara:strand:- start:11736 stop:12323 length:588 start_codon:yes stop_codon:yes gene_type:complete
MVVIINKTKIPDFTLSESIKFIKPMLYTNIDLIKKDYFARIIGLSDTGGAFNLRLSSARLWGLITNGNPFQLTSLGNTLTDTSYLSNISNDLYSTSKTFSILNRFTRDLPSNPTLDDVKNILNQKIEIKSLRRLRNLIIDIRLHRSNVSIENKDLISYKDLKLQLSGVNLEVEESKESIMAAIKLLEARLDLYGI